MQPTCTHMYTHVHTCTHMYTHVHTYTHTLRIYSVHTLRLYSAAKQMPVAQQPAAVGAEDCMQEPASIFWQRRVDALAFQMLRA